MNFWIRRGSIIVVFVVFVCFLFFFFFFFSGSDYKAFNGKRIDDIKDKGFSKPHNVPTENHRIRGTGTSVEYSREKEKIER